MQFDKSIGKKVPSGITKIIKMSGLASIKDKRIRVSKFDENVGIRNFIYYLDESTKINIFPELTTAYSMLSDESIKDLSVSTPCSIEHLYLEKSRHAFLNGQLYIFGGRRSPSYSNHPHQKVIHSNNLLTGSHPDFKQGFLHVQSGSKEGTPR